MGRGALVDALSQACHTAQPESLCYGKTVLDQSDSLPDPLPELLIAAGRRIVTASGQFGYFSRKTFNMRLSCSFSPAVLGAPAVSSVSAESWWASTRTATSLRI